MINEVYILNFLRDKMELLGIVEDVIADGRAIVIGKSLPDINSTVFDQRERKVGKIKRIFGPVDEPYITVIVDDKETVQYLKNKPLYYTKGTQNGKNKGRNRRN